MMINTIQISFGDQMFFSRDEIDRVICLYKKTLETSCVEMFSN